MRIRLAIFLVFSGLCGSLVRADGARWELVWWPSKPSVGTLLVSGSKLYAGTEDYGVFLSEDDGLNWVMLSEGIPFRPGAGLTKRPRVTCLAVMGPELFVGTEYRGVFRTGDRGASWKAANTGFALEAFFRELGVQPELWISCFAVTGTKIFAGQTDFGIFVSTDSGASWKPTGPGMPNDPAVVSLVASGNDLFAGTELGSVYYFSGSEKKWEKRPLELARGTQVKNLAFSGSCLAAGTQAGLFLTVDNGKHWTKASGGLPEGVTISALAVHGISIYAGTEGDGVFVSTDQGARWSALNERLLDLDVLSLASGESYLFAGTRQGVWRMPLREDLATLPVGLTKPDPSD